MTPEEINKLSDSDLLVIVNLYNKIGDDYELAVREYCRRQELKENENKKQLSVSIHWSKIAGIAALIGLVLMIVQILISIFQYTSPKNNDPLQSQNQNSQTPTKISESLPSAMTVEAPITPQTKTK